MKAVSVTYKEAVALMKKSIILAPELEDYYKKDIKILRQLSKNDSNAIHKINLGLDPANDRVILNIKDEKGKLLDPYVINEISRMIDNPTYTKEMVFTALNEAALAYSYVMDMIQVALTLYKKLSPEDQAIAVTIIKEKILNNSTPSPEQHTSQNTIFNNFFSISQN